MSNQMANEFITLYQKSPVVALKWLEETEINLDELFTDRAAFEQLAKAFYAARRTAGLKIAYAKEIRDDLGAEIRSTSEQIKRIQEHLDWLLDRVGIKPAEKADEVSLRVKSTSEQIEETQKGLNELLEKVGIKKAETGKALGFKWVDDTQEKVAAPISKLLEKAGAQIARIYDSAAQFLTLEAADPLLASMVYDCAPEHISDLFLSAKAFLALTPALALKILKQYPDKIEAIFLSIKDFLALEKADYALAKSVFESKRKQIFASLISAEEFWALAKTNHSMVKVEDLFDHDRDRTIAFLESAKQFLELYKTNKLLAKKMFGHDPDAISALFINYKQFLKLEKTSLSMALNIFDHGPDKIAALFGSVEQFMELVRVNSSLAWSIFHCDPVRFANLFTQQEHLSVIKRTNPALAVKIYEHAQHELNSDNTINYSFYLETLGSLAVIAGIGIVAALVGVFVAQPIIAIVSVGAASIAGLSFFAVSAHMAERYITHDSSCEFSLSL